MKTVMIIGVGGQDGSYLLDYFMEKELKTVVVGVHRRSSLNNLHRVQRHLTNERFIPKIGDLCDTISIARLVNIYDPEEIYNLADQDDVRASYDTPCYNYDVTGAAVGRLLEYLRVTNSQSKFFQAISATIFGAGTNLDYDSSLNPKSPYACAKAFALHLCRYYRQAGVKVSNAILFNHDSPRRGQGYLLQKLADHFIYLMKNRLSPAESKSPHSFSDLDLQVDIGHAKEYVETFPMINRNQEAAVIGNPHKMTIREIIREERERLGFISSRIVERDSAEGYFPLLSHPHPVCSNFMKPSEVLANIVDHRLDRGDLL